MDQSKGRAMPDELLLSTLSQFEALSGPDRMRILKHATNPVTVGELADLFGVPKTRLYYHVNRLVEESLLVEVATRKSGARIERIYQTAATSFRPGPELLTNIDDPRKAAEVAAGVVFDPARAETEDMLERNFSGEEIDGELGRSLGRLTDEQVERVRSKLHDLLDEFRGEDVALDTESRTFALTFTFIPTQPGEDQ